ncbi:MAG: Gfo/Idh/MocA family oxidoreductase [Verrucomicrobia bacterium]|nr:Gfo/Idh/MocA family oxidoreductase [Verrucomicrobiota bacterium]
MQSTPLSRRRFLQSTALLTAAPLILPSRVWAQASAPSKRFNVGCIGMGKQMGGHLRSMLPRDDVQVVAVCDVDTTRRENAKKITDEAYAKKNDTAYKGCAAYNDFRELLARPDIDLVLIATPDHWHAYIAIAAVKAGKDVYCEKPLTYNVHEAVELEKAVRKANRVFQVGSQQRSSKEFRVAAELVRNGVLGRVHAVGVSFGDPAKPYNMPAEEMEPGLDWNLWCGPGPLVNYNPMLSPRGLHNHFPKWRDTWEFGGGMITDWGAHHIDIAQWGLGMDENGPVEVRAPQNWQEARRGAQLVYADGTVLTHVRGKGVSFYGTEGEVHVNRGKFEFIRDGKTIHKFWDKEIDKGTSMEREVTLTEREFLADAKVKLYNSKSHFQDFIDCVVSRKRPICDVAIGASSVIACHVMNFAYHFGANAKWDPVRKRFASGGSSKWLTRDRYRDKWAV